MSLLTDEGLAGGLEWPELAGLRERAAERFRTDGLPGRKTEHWKYTSVKAMGDFQAVPTQVEAGPAVVAFDALTPADRQVTLQHLGRLATLDGHAFAALNTALLAGGLLLRVPAGVRLEAPVEITWSTPSAGCMRHPRLLIVAEKNSEFRVIERFVGDGEGPSLTNAVTEIVVGEGAQVHHCRVQADGPGAFQIGRIAVEVQRDGTWTSSTLNLGGALGRTEVDVALVGTGSEARLHGLFAGQGARHLDQHITVEHRSPRATSYQDFRGILGRGARGVFTGKVHVAPGAHHARAEQQNRNLLLDSEAHVDTRPQLEILNDDVQCSHGATIGRLDEKALFYLRARGIPVAEARHLLTLAFAAPTIAALPTEALRAFARDWLDSKALPAEPS